MPNVKQAAERSTRIYVASGSFSPSPRGAKMWRMVASPGQRLQAHRHGLLTLFELVVFVPTAVVITYQVARLDAALATDEWLRIAAWVVLIALVELMPVPMWRGTHIGVGFPLLMVVAFMYPAEIAAAAAFLAASDPREIKGQI